jgi:hypothetical protein
MALKCRTASVRDRIEKPKQIMQPKRVSARNCTCKIVRWAHPQATGLFCVSYCGPKSRARATAGWGNPPHGSVTVPRLPLGKRGFHCHGTVFRCHLNGACIIRRRCHRRLRCQGIHFRKESGGGPSATSRFPVVNLPCRCRQPKERDATSAPARVRSVSTYGCWQFSSRLVADPNGWLLTSPADGSCDGWLCMSAAAM